MAVANQKGGVGKSTTAVSLGAALAEMSHRVLVVDLDPQGNASTGLGIRHEAREVTVYDVLAADADVRKAIVATPLENLYAVPSTIDLAGAEIELVSQFSREMRLRRALEPLRSGVFEFILLDCPPSLGLLTINALAAAGELLVPIQCEYYALEGLGQLLRNVRLVQQNVNPSLRLSGIVMTMFDPRTKLSEQVVDEVRKYFGDLVYRTIIPRTVRLSEAPGFGQPITVYDPRSRGAECYRDLAAEVAVREAPEGPLPVLDETPTVVVEPVAPPPPARSAPRPLREIVPDVDTTPDAEGAPDADLPAPRDAAAVEGRTTEADTAAVPGQVEVPTAVTPSEPESRDDAVPEEDVQVQIPASSADRVGGDDTHREANRSGEDEPPGVVVIDAYALDSDVAPQSAVEGNGVRDEGEDADEDDGRRKRWSLFRRGGRG